MSDELQPPVEDGEDVQGDGEETTHVIDEEFLNEEVDFSPALLETGKEGEDYAPATVASSGDDPGSFAPVKIDPGGIGELLLRENVVSLVQLEEAQREIVKFGGRLGHTLAKLGYVEETQLVQFLSRQYGVPSIEVEEVEIPVDVVDLIPQSVAEKHSLIPVNLQGSSLIVAMSDPSNIYAMDDIKFLTGYNV